jgi:hypothetical protein
MGDHDTRLRALADRVDGVFRRHTAPDASLLAGSIASGGADEHSDLDLLLYYRALPPDEAIAASRDELAASDLKVIAPRSEAGLLEQFAVDGVQCQVGHMTLADVDATIRKVVLDLDPDPYAMKELGGLHDAVALSGADVIGRWRAAAQYTDALQQTIVDRHWKIFPLWRLQEHIAARDAELWRRQILVDGAYDLLAVLAAANRVWFSSFQLKRTRKLVGQLDDAPPDLAGRLESLFTLTPSDTEETRAILVRLGLLAGGASRPRNTRGW